MKLTQGTSNELTAQSLPLRECGLKSRLQAQRHLTQEVTPLAGVWIEITDTSAGSWQNMSLPLRECGLKYNSFCTLLSLVFVTPLAGVWIEMFSSLYHRYSLLVTPLAGVWIEIFQCVKATLMQESLPLRECGLKLWRYFTAHREVSHSPCGSVD